jgi:wyosine [tRNA(Phe)-imidazoG37] synthetase (radical SAM superfamily)
MEKEHLILHSAMESNILPIISACDAKCVFCSHKDNVSGIRVVSIPPRTLDEVEWTLSFLDSRKKITIGESATSIIEGEPLCHPEFVQIITTIRKKFPGTLLSITTNGHGLDNKLVCFLKEVEPVEINISLNSATVKGRAVLMGDDQHLAEQTINGIRRLQQHQIPFHGSIVAMPHLVGWADIAETVQYLAKNGALNIRLFMPGYSKNASPELHFDPLVMHQELRRFVKNMVGQISCPLLLEPPLITELVPIVAGVIRDSEAYRAGLRQGDVIKKVNELVPRSRVEGWNLLQQPGQIHTKIERDGLFIDLEWDNRKGGYSGAIMEYDFDMRRLEALNQIINACIGKVLLLPSELGFAVLTAAIRLLKLPKGRVEIQVVKNHLFGGSIGAAGLLSVADFAQAFADYSSCHDRPDLIVVPQEAFDCQGYDLTECPYWQLAESTGIDVKLG